MSEKPLGYRPRRLAEWINPTGEKKVHSLVLTNTVFKPLREEELMKAVCGKTARTVWAADGGKPLNRRLLRLDSVESLVMRWEQRGGMVLLN